MSKEIFIALSGGMAYQRQLEVAANNIANVSTSGFKQDRAVFSVARPEFEAQGRTLPPPGTPANLLAHSYAAAAQSYVDFSGGAIEVTGDSMDLAIEGEGFFAIQGEKEVLHTRSGELKVNKEGMLVNYNNMPFLGERGPITVPGADFKVSTDGTVSANGQIIDRLRIERFAPDAELKKMGDTMFSAGGATAIAGVEGTVQQGALERSNLDPMRGMLELIMVQRNYESFTKVMTTMNEIDSKTNARVKI